MASHSRRNPLSRALLLALTLAPISCGSRELKVAISPTYSSIQQVTLSSKCLYCHPSLDSYEGVMKVVSAGSSRSSRLYREISGGSMPQQSPALSTEEKEAIAAWIDAGALNN